MDGSKATYKADKRHPELFHSHRLVHCLELAKTFCVTYRQLIVSDIELTVMDATSVYSLNSFGVNKYL